MPRLTTRSRDGVDGGRMFRVFRVPYYPGTPLELLKRSVRHTNSEDRYSVHLFAQLLRECQFHAAAGRWNARGKTHRYFSAAYDSSFCLVYLHSCSFFAARFSFAVLCLFVCKGTSRIFRYLHIVCTCTRECYNYSMSDVSLGGS